jgi:hypothetical protein
LIASNPVLQEPEIYHEKGKIGKHEKELTADYADSIDVFWHDPQESLKSFPNTIALASAVNAGGGL